MAEMAHIGKKTISKRVSRLLGLDLHSWEQVMLFSLGLAALAAVAVVVTTAAVVISQRDENTRTKADFEKYKVDASVEIASVRSEADTKIALARDEAQVAVGKANAEIAEATKAIAEARTETARALEEAAKAKERTVFLQKELDERKNRTVSREQREAVIARLKPLPKGKVWFNALFGDGEAIRFSDQIQAVLKEAGYEVEEVPQGERIMSVNRVGVLLFFKDVNNPPERAKNISTAFRLVGIEIFGDPQPDFTDPDKLVLVVSSHH